MPFTHKATIIPTEMEVEVDKIKRIVSLRFWNDEKKNVNVWLIAGSVFELQAAIDRAVQAVPEMTTWKPGYRPN
jgi:hypothetical protein